MKSISSDEWLLFQLNIPLKAASEALDRNLLDTRRKEELAEARRVLEVASNNLMSMLRASDVSPAVFKHLGDLAFGSFIIGAYVDEHESFDTLKKKADSMRTTPAREHRTREAKAFEKVVATLATPKLNSPHHLTDSAIARLINPGITKELEALEIKARGRSAIIKAIAKARIAVQKSK